MSRNRAIAAILGAMALPLILVALTYFISVRSFETTASAVPVSSAKLGTPRPPSPDISGKCDEAEHAGDPECAPGATRREERAEAREERREERADRREDRDDDSGRDHPEDD